MRRQVAIAGHGAPGLSLIPQLEANPEVEICALLTPDPEATRTALRTLDPALADRLDERITPELAQVLDTPELEAVVDCGVPPSWQADLAEATRRGVQVISPLLARLRFGFISSDPSHRARLLAALKETLDSFDLTGDPAELLERILEASIAASGATDGSILLYDHQTARLRLHAATGIETELRSKVSLAAGEGIAGRAFELKQARLVAGKADPDAYRIAHPRADVDSALVVPLLHRERAIGVMCVSRTPGEPRFGTRDLHFLGAFVGQVAAMIVRTQAHDILEVDASRLRTRESVQQGLSENAPLFDRLQRFCSSLSRELEGGVCHLYLCEPGSLRMSLASSSTTADPLGEPPSFLPGEGHVGWVSQHRRALQLSTLAGAAEVHGCTLPVEAFGELLGVLSLEGVSAPGGAPFLRERIDASVELLGLTLADARRLAQSEHETRCDAELNEAALRMRSCEEAAELYHLLVASASMILETDHAVLRLRNPASQALEIRAYFGSAEADALAPLFRLERTFAAEVLDSGRALRRNELDRHPGSDAYDAEVSNLIQEPIVLDGTCVGILSVLEKHSNEWIGRATFSEADAGVLHRLVLHAGQHLGRIHPSSDRRAPEPPNPVNEPPDRSPFELRLEQELARSSTEGLALALIRLRIEGLGELHQRIGNTEADRIAGEITRQLEETLRDSDVVARTDSETFELLIPEPDEEISSLIGSLARRSAEPLRELEQQCGAQLRLEFGYARFPEDGSTCAALTAHSEQARLRSFR